VQKGILGKILSRKKLKLAGPATHLPMSARSAGDLADIQRALAREYFGYSLFAWQGILLLSCVVFIFPQFFVEHFGLRETGPENTFFACVLIVGTLIGISQKAIIHFLTLLRRGAWFGKWKNVIGVALPIFFAIAASAEIFVRIARLPIQLWLLLAVIVAVILPFFWKRIFTRWSLLRKQLEEFLKQKNPVTEDPIEQELALKSAHQTLLYLQIWGWLSWAFLFLFAYASGPLLSAWASLLLGTFGLFVLFSLRPEEDDLLILCRNCAEQNSVFWMSETSFCQNCERRRR
jgi:hypothetical protein